MRGGIISENVWIQAIIYLDRLKKSPYNLKLTWSNVRRSLGTVLMISQKIMEDKFYPNSFYAKMFDLEPKGISFFTHIQTYYLILISDIFL